jgi:hypothetical protein
MSEGLERADALAEFERAGADWMAAHITRRNMAGVNWG